MLCDLARIFDSLMSCIPSDLSFEDGYIFDEDTFPPLPSQIKTDSIYIRKTYHDYNSLFRADQLWFYASKPSYRYLGLLILAVVFRSDVSRVTVELTHPESDIKHLIVEFIHRDRENLYPGYTSRPYALHYFPEKTYIHPWIYEYRDPHDLPCFFLTNREECIINEEGWPQRDTVVGFGSDVGSVRLAELLLNAGLSTNDVAEHVLESEGGVRGVGVHSAEASFFILSE